MALQERLENIQVFLQVGCQSPELLDETVLSLEKPGQVLGGGEQVAVISPRGRVHLIRIGKTLD